MLASCSDNEMTMTDLSVDARLLATERGAAPRINSAAVTFASALVVAGAVPRLAPGICRGGRRSPI